MKEQWRPIPGYEGLYEVSNKGRIKNPRTSVMKGSLYKGYMKTLLYTEDKPRKKRRLMHIHRLVAMAWIPNPDKKPYINHINGIKHDNRIQNLEWCTTKENCDHAYRIGLRAGGERHGTAKLKLKDILKIRKSNLSQDALANIYGVCQVNISSILRKKIWKTV